MKKTILTATDETGREADTVMCSRLHRWNGSDER